MPGVGGHFKETCRPLVTLSGAKGAIYGSVPFTG